jgi:hypothetical protein
MLGNCYFVVRVLGVAPAEAAMCWAPSLAELSCFGYKVCYL